MLTADSTARRARRAAALAVLALSLLLAAAPVPAASVVARPASAAALAQADICAALSAVPPADCAALVALYTSTNGADWVAQNGWLTASPNAPCDWRGVGCADGRVTELRLPRNRLSGRLPAALAELTALERVSLAGNQLVGVVPPEVCLLAERGVQMNLAFNGLTTGRRDTSACLEQLDPDWADTQTRPPRDLRPGTITETSLQLSWTVGRAGPGGYYELSYATEHDGPFSLAGRTADALSTGYTIEGLLPGTTYYLQVEAVTPAHAGNPAELRSNGARLAMVTRSSETVLLIVYFPADNDLSPYVIPVIERIRKGTLLNPNAQVALLSDQDGAGDTAVVTIADGVVTPTDAVMARWGTNELDTADEAVLAWFLRRARELFPADRTIVSLMGHGLALAPELAWAEEEFPAAGGPGTAASPRGRIPALPKGSEATPTDVTDGGYMSTVALGRALALATDNGTRPFDLLFFDQCFQGNLDTLYEVRTAADYFIASPNYAWLAAPYRQYLAMLAPAASLEEISRAIIMLYQRSLDNQHPNVIFALRRSDIEAAAAAVSALGEALERAVQAGERTAIAEATRGSEYVDTTQCGRQNLSLGPPDELIGAGTFAMRLREAFAPSDSYGIRAAAQALLASLNPIVKSVRVGSPYIAPDERWAYDNTLTILAPLPPNSPADIAWRSTIYTADVPLAATWTPAPTMTVQVSASFAFVRDGKWDEFLAAWYTDERPPTVGQWCSYTPPALVPSEEPESLALSAADAGPGAVRLSWTASSKEISDYWLYSWDPATVSWVVRQTVPSGQTTALIGGLAPGEAHLFRVVAQDEAGVALSESNEVEWTAGHLLFMPVLR